MMATCTYTSSKLFFEWIAPMLVADGLLVPAAWHSEHALVAASEFTDPRLEQAAVILAALDPGALDTIAQAPVLVLAAAGECCGGLNYRRHRQQLAARFLAVIAESGRLPHILRSYQLAPVMRRLAGAPLAMAHHQVLALLATIPERTLAQIIPATGAEQRLWLEWLTGLVDRPWPARHGGADRFGAWAATNARTPAQWFGCSEIIDWLVLGGGVLDPAMSYAQTSAAAARWHRAQAVRPRQVLTASEPIVDYAPLPVESIVDGLVFKALRSISDLEEESVRMHHCVRDYWPYVFSGNSRIYSIRRGNARRATFELQVCSASGYAIRRWSRCDGVSAFGFGQLKGPCNAMPDGEITAAAKRFLEIAESEVRANGGLPGDVQNGQATKTSIAFAPR